MIGPTKGESKYVDKKRKIIFFSSSSEQQVLPNLVKNNSTIKETNYVLLQKLPIEMKEHILSYFLFAIFYSPFIKLLSLDKEHYDFILFTENDNIIQKFKRTIAIDDEGKFYMELSNLGNEKESESVSSIELSPSVTNEDHVNLVPSFEKDSMLMKHWDKDFTEYSQLNKLKIKNLDSVYSQPKIKFSENLKYLTVDGFNIFIEDNTEAALFLLSLKCSRVNEVGLKWIVKNCLSLQYLNVKIEESSKVEILNHIMAFNYFKRLLENPVLKEVSITCDGQFFEYIIRFFKIDYNKEFQNKIKKISLYGLNISEHAENCDKNLSCNVSRMTITHDFLDIIGDFKDKFNHLKKLNLFKYFALPPMPFLEKLKVNRWYSDYSNKKLYKIDHFPRLRILKINEDALFYFRNCKVIEKLTLIGFITLNFINILHRSFCFGEGKSLRKIKILGQCRKDLDFTTIILNRTITKLHVSKRILQHLLSIGMDLSHLKYIIAKDYILLENNEF
ncbi:hypothetical protein ABK040_014903 [Willaertia magna]